MSTQYQPPRNAVVAHHMVTTAFDLDGYRVVRNLGVVRGIVVRSRSLFGTLGASLQTLVGGNITLFTELCEKTRNEACSPALLADAARSTGACRSLRRSGSSGRRRHGALLLRARHLFADNRCQVSSLFLTPVT